MDDVVRLLRRQTQKSQRLKTVAATTAAPTPAPIPAFAPVASPWLIREPCETFTTVAIDELLVDEGFEDDMEDEVDKGLVVYQCVDVMNVTTVLSLLIKTTTAVLVDRPTDTDVTASTVEPCTEVVLVRDTGAGAGAV
jgi:hypothetical protein